MNRIIQIISFIIISFSIFNISDANAARRTISSIMIDAETGTVLYSSNADERRAPASLTKMMTLYITFNALDKGIIKMEDMLPVSRTAANRSPSKLGLKIGEKIKVRDAIMALIVKSANDCATVLAEGLGYSEEKFAQTMTQVAKELGMKNTTFKNASGLPNRHQKSTARDMAVLGAAIYHHYPQYYKLFSTKKFTYNGRTYYTHNHLLKSFSGADGLKTGFTNAAGYNIVTSAERDGNRVIAVTMGHNTIKERDKQIANMMNKGLKKLALADNIPTPNLYAQTTNSGNSKKLLAEKNWGVQVGAFSNYAKARNYALSIRQQVNMSSVRNSIVDIEPTNKGAAIVYRSKLIGFEKNEADKTCNRLKKTNKSCIVVEVIENKQLAMADKK
ncbi:MAG: D-alanyl-D-alanine carboxypeptidase [Alphaproteobacteria bacterium]|nr:D-alanyl-D-alanine carboxypeptidase [Alphaproteobacteria bacterium]